MRFGYEDKRIILPKLTKKQDEMISKEIQKDKLETERLKRINQRLRKPLFKGGARTKMMGGGLRVSADSGIKGLLRI